MYAVFGSDLSRSGMRYVKLKILNYGSKFRLGGVLET